MEHELIKAKIIELVPEIMTRNASFLLKNDTSSFSGIINYRDERITLADVLRAILMQDMTREQIRELLHVQSHEAAYLVAKTVSIWNLTTDYDGQTQEVKEFIGKLLNV